MHMTNRLIAALKEKIGNRTQLEAARDIGISCQCINKWLNGVIEDLRESNARKLCTFLGIDYVTDNPGKH